MYRGEYTRMLGILHAIREAMDPYPPLGSALNHILTAICQFMTGDRRRAVESLEHALCEAMPDGFVYLFAVYHSLLQGQPEVYVRKNHPEYLPRYLEIKDRFHKGS